MAGSSGNTYDAIVVGGGHNGLTNAAYLAQSGLNVLVLERRGFVGGAAITEELHPGFSFTTFSYALSLLRPEIIQELELVKHGFLPLLMPTHFAPMDDGDYLLLTEDEQFNDQEIAPAQQARRRRLPPLGARPGEGHPAGHAVLQRGPARHLQRRPGRPGRRRLDGQAAAGRRPEDPPRPDPVPHRQLRRPARRLLRVRHHQGVDRVVRHHRQQGRPDVAGLRPRAALPPDGRAGRPPRGLGLPQGRQRRLHAGAAAGGRVVRGDRAPGGAGRPRDHQGRAGDRRRAHRRHGVLGADRGQRPRPAPYVHRAGRPARAAERPERGDRPLPLPGHLGEGELRPRRPPGLPGAQGPDRPLRWLRQHRAVHGVPRARLRRRQVRLVLQHALHRRGDPVRGRPRHGARRAST